jgi:hypothetical protein
MDRSLSVAILTLSPQRPSRALYAFYPLISVHGQARACPLVRERQGLHAVAPDRQPVRSASTYFDKEKISQANRSELEHCGKRRLTMIDVAYNIHSTPIRT